VLRLTFWKLEQEIMRCHLRQCGVKRVGSRAADHASNVRRGKIDSTARQPLMRGTVERLADSHLPFTFIDHFAQV
jgi:hypothetical protein